MPLVDMKDLLDHARGNGYAVAAFGLGSLELLEAIMSTSERSRSPVILSLTESHFERYDFELAMAATERAARRAEVPVAIHLDHGASFSSAVRAISLGCNGVMVDASRENFPTNVPLTHRVVEMAHACGVTVEGELGYVAGEGGNARPGDVVYTPVEEARVYAERTQLDCLAVSVGAVHGPLRGRPRLDYERLKRIHEAVDIPLVIHGASGLSDEQIRRLVAYGVAKINHYTALSDVAARAIRANAKAGGGGYLDLHLGVRDAVSAEVERCQRVCGATGRAAEVLARCRPWRPAKRVLLYNVEGGQDAEVEAIMARGREALSKIPGVRHVVTGWAVTQTPRHPDTQTPRHPDTVTVGWWSLPTRRPRPTIATTPISSHSPAACPGRSPRSASASISRRSAEPVTTRWRTESVIGRMARRLRPGFWIRPLVGELRTLE